jgi:hypothetical protein
LNNKKFVDWFNKGGIYSDIIMQYIVTCAVGAGESRVWKNPKTQAVHTWKGNLGLAPRWAAGEPATEAEQQVISACLAAHVNKFGAHVVMSIQGLNALEVPLPTVEDELKLFPEREGCFFGNLFTGKGLFAGNDATWSSTSSSVRACGLERAKPSGEDQCPPIHHVGRCRDFCVADPQDTYYLSCTYEGKSYRVLTTRLKREDIYRCGDGICQVSESCGTGTTPDNCRDCGACL